MFSNFKKSKGNLTLTSNTLIKMGTLRNTWKRNASVKLIN